MYHLVVGPRADKTNREKCSDFEGRLVNFNVHLREFVCETHVILAQACEEWGAETVDCEGGEDGTRGAQTLRFPTFYACPRLPLECGAFFLKTGTLAAALCVLKSHGHPLEACQDQFSNFF